METKKAGTNGQESYRLRKHRAEQSDGGNYYCRAVHGVLNATEDGFYCAEGCPCFDCFEVKENHKVPVCTYFDRENTICIGTEKFMLIQKQLDEGVCPLFPDAKPISPRMHLAYQFAANAHKGQLRKGKKMPYMTHLLQTLNYVMLLTTEEDICIAALLHDCIEDTSTTKSDLEQNFGGHVAALVANESEDKMRERPPADTWELRKKSSIARLKVSSREVKIIALADKTANLKSLSLECRLFGEDVWLRFNQKDMTKQKWYYTACKEALLELQDTPLMRYYEQFFHMVFEK